MMTKECFRSSIQGLVMKRAPIAGLCRWEFDSDDRAAEGVQHNVHPQSLRRHSTLNYRLQAIRFQVLVDCFEARGITISHFDSDRRGRVLDCGNSFM